MHLTKIELDLHRRCARKLLTSPHVMHAVVMKACQPGGESGQSDATDGFPPGRVLWRVDSGSFGVSLYILSPRPPELIQLESEAGLGDTARTLDYEGFLDKLSNGQHWAFRLSANPIHSVPGKPGTRGKRYGHVTVEHQRKWLLERTGKYGFSIAGADAERDGKAEDSDGSSPLDASSVLIVRRDRPVFYRNRRDGQRRDRVTISRVVYEGVLRIDDAEPFKRMLVGGLGPSKAYGCGLMTLARPKRS